VDQKVEYEKLDDVVITRHGSGRPVMRFSVQLQLFLSQGADLATRHAVIDVLEGFRQLAPDRVTHLQPHLENRLLPIASVGFPAFGHAEAARLDPLTEDFGPHLTSVPAAPPQWQGYAALASAEAGPGAISALDLSVPPSFVRADPDRYLAYVLDWCARVKPMHGLAGFAPVYEIGMEANYMQETWPFLARFPGLQYPIPYPMAAEGQGQRRISGTGWLTILGDQPLAAIGGRDRLARRLTDAWADVMDDAPAAVQPPDLPGGLSLHDYAGGVVIRAGTHPQMGDINMGNIPEAYCAVSDALRPIRFEDYQQNPMDLIRVPRPLDAYEETMNWLRRFDVVD
jgi:hypothetical protein